MLMCVTSSERVLDNAWQLRVLVDVGDVRHVTPLAWRLVLLTHVRTLPLLSVDKQGTNTKITNDGCAYIFREYFCDEIFLNEYNEMNENEISLQSTLDKKKKVKSFDWNISIFYI